MNDFKEERLILEEVIEKIHTIGFLIESVGASVTYQGMPADADQLNSACIMLGNLLDNANSQLQTVYTALQSDPEEVTA